MPPCLSSTAEFQKRERRGYLGENLKFMTGARSTVPESVTQQVCRVAIEGSCGGRAEDVPGDPGGLSPSMGGVWATPHLPVLLCCGGSPPEGLGAYQVVQLPHVLTPAHPQILRQNRGRKACDRPVAKKKKKKKAEGTVFTEEDFQKFQQEYFGS